MLMACLGAGLKASYCLREIGSTNKNKIKIKSIKHKDILYSDQFLLKFAPKYPFDTISTLLHVMVWQRTGDKRLSKPVMTKIHDATWRHYWQSHIGF